MFLVNSYKILFLKQRKIITKFIILNSRGRGGRTGTKLILLKLNVIIFFFSTRVFMNLSLFHTSCVYKSLIKLSLKSSKVNVISHVG